MNSIRQAFTIHEYQQRLSRIKSWMSKEGIDGLILTAPENILYATGYEAWSFYVPQAALITLREEQPIWIGREQDTPCAIATAWIDANRMHGYPDDYLVDSDLHPVEFIAERIAEYGLAEKVIGAELDNCYFTAKAYKILRNCLPGASFLDITSVVNHLRLVRSAQEIEYMREAGVIATQAMQIGVEAIKPGRRECDVCAEITAAQIRGTDTFGGDAPTEIILMARNDEISCPHLAWTDRVFEVGDQINIELGGVRRRYNAGLARSIFLGPTPDPIKRLADATCDAVEAALAALKPGTVAEDVYFAYSDALSKHGKEKTSRIGYTIGAAYPPAWVDESVSFWPGDRTVLAAGMTFHLMCGMWMGETGFVQSETVLITADGCELLTNYPQGLVEKQTSGNSGTTEAPRGRGS